MLKAGFFYILAAPLINALTLPGNIKAPINGAPSCGYHQQGSLIDITGSIQLCLPPVFCNPETCPPGLGKCIDGRCHYLGSYQGLATHKKAGATYYCELKAGGCQGALGGDILGMAQHAAGLLSIPLCDETSSGNCMGIAASSPMVIGNSQIATFNGSFLPLWGLGYSYASGVCYELTGPGGVVTVAMTDRCAGYCRCDGSKNSNQDAFHECGERQCFDSPNMFPNQPCSGTLPQLGYNTCGAYGCPVPLQKCDWCASNNHPHFDLDVSAFHRLCGSAGSAGSCEITAVRPIPCNVGVEPPSPAGNNAASTPENAWNCGGVSYAVEQPVIPGSQFCCNWNCAVNADQTACVCGGSSGSGGGGFSSIVETTTNSGAASTANPAGCNVLSPAPARAFDCNCVSPAAQQPLIPGTRYCCYWGMKPNAAKNDCTF